VVWQLGAVVHSMERRLHKTRSFEKEKERRLLVSHAPGALEVSHARGRISEA
jgi:hypothetical protein